MTTPSTTTNPYPVATPAGMALREDGPFGLDLVRPCGIVWNGVSAATLGAHHFIGGWMRSWAEAGSMRNASLASWSFVEPGTASRYDAIDLAEHLGWADVFEVPGGPDGARTTARSLDGHAIAWSRALVGNVLLTAEAHDATVADAVALAREVLAAALAAG